MKTIMKLRFFVLALNTSSKSSLQLNLKVPFTLVDIAGQIDDAVIFWGAKHEAGKLAPLNKTGEAVFVKANRTQRGFFIFLESSLTLPSIISALTDS